jgi:hypothetical protein
VKFKKTIMKILKKHGDLQTNLASSDAQEQITKEIIAAFGDLFRPDPGKK